MHALNPSPAPPLADVSTAVDNIVQVGINLAAIVGAFIIGMILTHLLLLLVQKRALKRDIPRPVRYVCRVAGGILLAILVALYVFGEGGFGLGWGGTGRPGPPDGKAPEVNQGTMVPDPEKKVEPKKEEPKKKEAEKQAGPNRVAVTILGGFDPLQRYYRLEGTDQRLTFSELTQHLQRRMEEPGKPLTGVEILVYSNSAARESPVVAQLERWARGAGLGVYFPPVQDQPIP